MERKAMESSNIQSVGYDQKTSTLEIEFNGGAVYQYFDVPPEAHKQLMEAESAGRHFGTQIRGKFKTMKQEPEAPPKKAQGAGQ